HAIDAWPSRFVRIFRSDIAEQLWRRCNSVWNRGDIPNSDSLTPGNRGTFRFGRNATRDEQNNDHDESHSRSIHNGFLFRNCFEIVAREDAIFHSPPSTAPLFANLHLQILVWF